MSLVVKEKSKFVTILAWFFIVMGGLGSFISILQNLFMRNMPSLSQMQDGIDMLPMAKFVFENIDLILMFSLLFNILILIVGIGLLKRKNWARLSTITIMIFGVIWSIGGLFFQKAFMSQIPIPNNTSADFQAAFSNAEGIMFIISVIMSIAFSILYLWIVYRLRKKEIVDEFIK